MTTADSDFWTQRIAAHGLFSIRDSPRLRPIELGAQHFLFLRHGETEGNFKRIFQAKTIALNEAGRAQAQSAAGALADAGVQRIVASDLQRTRDTAGIVGAALGLQPSHHAGFQERWFGDLIGTSSANLDWSAHPPNGEHIDDFVQRTAAAFEQTLRDADGERTLVIAHGGTLYVLAFSLGVELDADMIQNATPLEFRRGPSGWTVEVVAGGAGAPPRRRNMGW